MILRRFLAFSLFFLSFTYIALAQQAACKMQVPVGVINVNGEPYRGLSANDFSAHLGKSSLSIKTAALDDGPRRVLLVVDTSKKLNSNSHKAEIDMVDVMLAAGRPGDTFALVVTHGEKRLAKFGDQRAKFTEIMNQDFESKAGQTVGILDAMMEGIDLFGSPVLGDAIVVMAAELDGNHKANPKSIAKALDDHRIRMFGLAMGAVNTRNVVSGGLVNSTYSQGLAYSRGGVDNQVLETGDDNFYPLTMNSGGLVRGVLNAKERFNPDDAKLKAILTLRAQQIFNSVSIFYNMEIEPPARTEEWKLDVVERVHKIAPQMWILQPHSVGPCS